MSQNVTRESAIEAIEHMMQYNGPGRREEAIRLLVPVQSIAATAADEALRALERDFPGVLGSGVLPVDKSGA